MSHLAEFRSEKDAFFGQDRDSPLTDAQRARFKGLAYFDESPGLAFKLTPDRINGHSEIELPVTMGGTTVTHRWATIAFPVDGGEATLTIFREEDDGPLFLPFRDGTAGNETYAVGRYVDAHLLRDGSVWVDFNYAYNPYCAYNNMWTCPIPPPENRISLPIRAGELAYPDAEH